MRRKLGWGLGTLAAALGISTTLWAQSGRVVSPPPPAKNTPAQTQWTRPAGAKTTTPPSTKKKATLIKPSKRSDFATMTQAEAEALIAPDRPPGAKQASSAPAAVETNPPPLSGSPYAPTLPQAPLPAAPASPTQTAPPLPELPGDPSIPSAPSAPSAPSGPSTPAPTPPAPIHLPDAPELNPPGDVAVPAPKEPARMPQPPVLVPLKDQAAMPASTVPPPAGNTAGNTGNAIARVPGEPYVTSGLMFLPDEPAIRQVAHTVPTAGPTLPSGPHIAPAAAAAPATTAGQPSSFLQDQLKRLIERTLGPSARQVQVLIPAPNHVHIRFAVRSEQEAPALVSRVREMPELASFTIDDVEVLLP